MRRDRAAVARGVAGVTAFLVWSPTDDALARAAAAESGREATTPASGVSRQSPSARIPRSTPENRGATIEPSLRLEVELSAPSEQTATNSDRCSRDPSRSTG